MINFRVALLFMFALLISCSKDIDTNLKPLNPHTLCHEVIPKRDVSFGTLPQVPKQRKVFFIGDVGYTVGDSGSLLKSMDGGSNWDIRLNFDRSNPLGPQSLTEARLTAIHFANKEVGYAGGQGEYDYVLKKETDAVLLKTVDGGETWVKSVLKNARIILDLLFFNDEEGIAILEIEKPNGLLSYNIYRTIDGGQNWRVAILDIKTFLNPKLNFQDGKVTFLAQNQKGDIVIVQSTNQGKTWSTFATPQDNCSKMHQFSRGLTYLICNSEVYKSTNNFEGWQMTKEPLFNESFVHFFSEEEGFVVDPIYEWVKSGSESYQEIQGYNLATTRDLGHNWKMERLSVECEINGISYLDPNGTLYVLNKNHEVIVIK